ncbi:hypothetical protein C8R47DRAFT_963840, partial [Mycena vitilis]
MKNQRIGQKLRTIRKRQTGRLRLTAFPPRPLSDRELHSIVTRHCRRLSPLNFVEHGCAVCGCLVSRRLLSPLSAFKGDFNL